MAKSNEVLTQDIVNITQTFDAHEKTLLDVKNVLLPGIHDAFSGQKERMATLIAKLDNEVRPSILAWPDVTKETTQINKRLGSLPLDKSGAEFVVIRTELAKVQSILDRMDETTVSTTLLTSHIARLEAENRSYVDAAAQSLASSFSAQMASIGQGSSASSGGSPPPGKREPLAASKMFTDLRKLSGDENFHDADD